ncbi:Replication factor A protein 2 [Basidiobolus ranarum]|uniref:Replication factor A protein 2 n=1 Tax=Basidiobolus ranarum TaxID=34480 RepID=A0ABR2WN19_9FUNG
MSMAGYGSYTSTYGGGFTTHSTENTGFSSPGITDSPSSKRESSNNQTLSPVTIKQLLGADQATPDAPFKIDNVEITQVTFVGVIRSVSEQSTNVSFVVEDGTGSVDIRMFINDDSDFQAQKRGELVQGIYVRVIGTIRVFSNKRYVLAFLLRPITDFNEVTAHSLETLFCHLSRVKSNPSIDYNSGFRNSEGNPFTANNPYAHNPSNNYNNEFSPLQRTIIDAVKSAPDTNEGVHIGSIAQALTGRFPREEISNAVEWLIGEGHLYSTVDDDHVKCTDAD